MRRARFCGTSRRGVEGGSRPFAGALRDGRLRLTLGSPLILLQIGEVVDCVQALVGLRAGLSEWGPRGSEGPIVSFQRGLSGDDDEFSGLPRQVLHFTSGTECVGTDVRRAPELLTLRRWAQTSPTHPLSFANPSRATTVGPCAQYASLNNSRESIPVKPIVFREATICGQGARPSPG